MSGEEIIAASSVSVWTTEYIPYGNQMTVLGAPVRLGDKWVAPTLETPAAQIRLDRETPAGERLIIMKRNGRQDSLLGYVGVPAEKLDEATEEITKAIWDNLRR